MKRKIEKFIPPAISAIKKHIEENEVVNKEYKGYIASLGTSIIQAGLLPALSFYTDVKTSPDHPNKNYILNCILEILRESKLYTIKTGNNENKLLFFVMCEALKEGISADNLYDSERAFTMQDINEDKINELKNIIMDIVISLKLALRLFVVGKENE